MQAGLNNSFFFRLLHRTCLKYNFMIILHCETIYATITYSNATLHLYNILFKWVFLLTLCCTYFFSTYADIYIKLLKVSKNVIGYR